MSIEGQAVRDGWEMRQVPRDLRFAMFPGSQVVWWAVAEMNIVGGSGVKWWTDRGQCATVGV